MRCWSGLRSRKVRGSAASMVTTDSVNLWLRGKYDLGNRPIWFKDGVPIGLPNAAEFDLTRTAARCHLYTNAECAPLSQMPPGNIAASVPVTCLVALVDLKASMEQLGQLMSANKVFSDERPMEERIEEVANAFSAWEKDGTLAFFRSCYESLYEAFQRPVEWIRDEYLQHWLSGLPIFVDEDQKTGRFDSFLEMVGAEWSLDNKSWQGFRFPIRERRGSTPQPGELMRSEDWKRISTDLGIESDLTLHLLTRSRAALEDRDHRAAVITAITAIESEVSRFVQAQMETQGPTLSQKQYRELAREAGISTLLQTLVTALAASAGKGDLKSEIQGVLKANTLRNQLVHGSRRDVSRTEAIESALACERLLALLLPANIRLRTPNWIPWTS